MGNMASIIKRKVLRPNNTSTTRKKCICRKEDECMPAQRTVFIMRNLVYQATVTTKHNQTDKKTYIGMTENEFKTSYSNHKTSFKHKKHLYDLKSTPK